MQPYTPFLTRRFDLAFHFASGLHHGQPRKGSHVPYIAHLMSVAALVLESGGDEDQAIAALLHDAMEDQGGIPTLDTIRRLFGDRVANVVRECSDSESSDPSQKLPWHQRKQTYLEHLRTASPDALLVSVADKLHNGRAILSDYRQIRDEIWRRFSREASKADQLEYYRTLVTTFRQTSAPVAMVDELDRVVTELERLSAQGEQQGPSSMRKHAGPGTASNQLTVPEPSFAERARTLLYFGRIGSLSTLSRKQPGFPFGSVMPYGLDDHGRPIFLISTMAMHTQNLLADPRASLLVTQPDASGDPLGASRVTLLGHIAPVPEPEVAEARKLYLERYANSKYWVDFEDFSFYRMDVVDVYYVGGFGVMGWVSASEYDRARPDPLADAAADIIQHMNADHRDTLVLLARVFAGIESQEATMTSVDRLGFHLRLKTQDGMRGARIAFLREVSSPAEARKVLVEMAQQARQRMSERLRAHQSVGV